eukprot:XP_001689504.1 predicted protein [Chlamydomonas reinhardtii]
MDAELLNLRAALNEKDLELIELREQHVHLVARTHEARNNWEAAMSSKDRAILQLEEALASRQRAVEQLLAATSHTADVDQELQEKTAQVQALEKVLGDARAKISSLKATVADQKRQLDAVHMQLQARGHEDARLEQLRVQLTSAFQGGLRGEELRVAQQRGDMHEELARGLTAEVIKLKELLARREQELRDMQERQAQAKHQVVRLQREVSRQRLSPGLDDEEGDDDVWAEDRGVHATTRAVASRRSSAGGGSGGTPLGALPSSRRLTADDSDLQRVYAELDELRRQRQAPGVGAGAAPLAPPQLPPMAPGAQQPGPGPAAAGARASPHSDPVAVHQYQQHQQLLLDQMAAQQRQHEAATSTMRLQLEALQQQLAGVAAKLQTRDAQAKKYKEAVRLLKVGRRPGDVEAHARDAESRLSEALRAAEQARVRQLDAQKRADDLARQVSGLESRLEEGDRKLGEARRAVERAEQRADRAERSLRDVETQLVDAERRANQAESYSATLERRLRDSEGRLTDVDRHAKDADSRAVDAEMRMKATEARALDAEKRSLDCESRLAVSERRLREAENQVTELTHRWRDCERQKQEAELQARAAEASAKQAKSDKDTEVMSITRTMEARRNQEARQLQDLQVTLERVTRSRDTAEARVLELESSLRGAERLVASLQAGASAESIKAVYEERVRALEEGIGSRDRTLAQLRDSLLAADVEYKKSLQALVTEVQAKTAALLEAERRFAELEGVMQRMVARASGAA